MSWRRWTLPAAAVTLLGVSAAVIIETRRAQPPPAAPPAPPAVERPAPRRAATSPPPRPFAAPDLGARPVAPAPAVAAAPPPPVPPPQAPATPLTVEEKLEQVKRTLPVLERQQHALQRQLTVAERTDRDDELARVRGKLVQLTARVESLRRALAEHRDPDQE